MKTTKSINLSIILIALSLSSWSVIAADTSEYTQECRESAAEAEVPKEELSEFIKECVAEMSDAEKEGEDSKESASDK